MRKTGTKRRLITCAGIAVIINHIRLWRVILLSESRVGCRRFESGHPFGHALKDVAQMGRAPVKDSPLSGSGLLAGVVLPEHAPGLSVFILL